MFEFYLYAYIQPQTAYVNHMVICFEITEWVETRMLLLGSNILSQKPWNSKKQHAMGLQNQMHPLPAKVI